MDTDKYEGHTEGAWIALNDNAVKTPKHDDPMAFIERRNDDGDVVSLSKADAQLIADAPLLLAEVKKLREQQEKILRLAETNMALEWGDTDASFEWGYIIDMIKGGTK